MSNVVDRATFWFMYAGKAPWDIGKPQRPFIAVADRVISPVLDAGCGTGENALFFAAQGHRVTGIDFLRKPIRRARGKAAEGALSVEFLVKDALTLGDWGERFATVIDSGLSTSSRTTTDAATSRGSRPCSFRAANYSYCASATRNRGQRARVGCRGRSSTTLSPTAGRSNPFRRPDSR
jgi:SAM-dependent methyltransferase